jgi:hypothetical protein
MTETRAPEPRLGDNLFFRYPSGYINRPPGAMRVATVAAITGTHMSLWVLDPDWGNQYFRVDVRDHGQNEGQWQWPDKA